MSRTEAAAISSIIVNNDVGAAFEANIDNLFVSHKDIWEGVKKYYFKYKALPSLEWVELEFKDFDPVITQDVTKAYIDKMRDEFIKNKCRNLFLKSNDRLNNISGSQVLEELFAEITDLTRISNNVRDLSIKDIQSAQDHYRAQAIRSAEMGGSPGIPTGFPAIDLSYPTGMAPGHLIVVIGWPSRGKSLFTSYLACNAMDQGFKAMIVSLEMAGENVRDRVYTILGSGVFKNSDLSKGNVDVDKFEDWSNKRFANTNDIVIVSTEGHDEVTPSMVQAKVDQHNPDLLICDYHNLFSDNNHSKGEIDRNRNISREFKRMAVSNNIPIVDITAATMSSISDQNDPPMLSQVAWSKAIEYDADMAMAVHKQPDSNIIEVVCRKNRYGPDFGMFLNWDINNGIVKELDLS